MRHMSRVLNLYRDQPMGIRLFVRTRHLLCPMERIEELLSREGRILEVGCGHGLFANLLAVASPMRNVLGVDPAPAKIQVAEQSASSLANVSYCCGYVADVAESGFDAVAILDVLYLLPPEDKQEVVRRCFELLRPGGVLMLKANDTAPRWKYQVTVLQEKVMTGLRLTMSGHGLHFHSREQNAALLREAGFTVERVVDLSSWLPYPHVALVARRPGG